MAQRVVLHIGCMKTGTSFLQTTLTRSAASHQEAGFRFLASYPAQARAVTPVLARPHRVETHGGWRALVQEAREFRGEAAVVSMEFLSFAKAHQVDAFLAPLAGLEVQVVLTVRDQFEVLPSQWQSYARRLGTDSWATYLRRIDPSRRRDGDRDSRAARTFGRAQQVDKVLKRWGEHPAVSRLDLVPVPGAGEPGGDLWARFAAAIGMPADIGTEVRHRVNRSLGYASSDLLRRVNAGLQGHPGSVYRAGMSPLVREVLLPRAAVDGVPILDRRAGEFARRSNQVIKQAVVRGGYPVHGSLDEALPVPDSVAHLPRRVPPPNRQKVQEAAITLWDRCAVELGPRRSRPSSLRQLSEGIAMMAPRTRAWAEATARHAR